MIGSGTTFWDRRAETMPCADLRRLQAEVLRSCLRRTQASEIVHPESGQTLPEGEVGELALSAPTKQALPLLRYRTRDLTRMTSEPCPCGRTGARVSSILGRTEDMVIVRGVNVFPSQIEHALLGVDGLAPPFQIVLSTRPDRQTGMLVRVEASEFMTNAATRVALGTIAHVKPENALGLSVPVELASPGTVPRSEGKAVRILDERRETR